MAEKRQTQIMDEREEIDRLYESLCQQPRQTFPEPGKSFEVPITHGVYVIYQAEDVLHVGRTIRGEKGLRQRLGNHLRGKSSFARVYLSRDGNKLRDKSFLFNFWKYQTPGNECFSKPLLLGNFVPGTLASGLLNEPNQASVCADHIEIRI